MQDQPKQEGGGRGGQAVAPVPAGPEAGRGGRGGPGAAAAQGAGRGRGAAQGPGIVFDSDMGRNIDAALALAMLYSLGSKGHVIAVGVSSSSLDAAAFCDAVGRFYAGDPAARSTGNSGVLPVGLAEDAPKLANPAMLAGPLGMTKVDGTPAFHHDVTSVLDTADVAVLYRNALLTQKDGEGVVVLAGPATNLARALAMKRYADVFAVKAGLLVVAAGAYPDGPPDPRIKADIGAARQLFANWPTPIVAVGTEVGNALAYPGRSIEADFSWSPMHPVVAAYRAFQPVPYDAPGQAMAAVLYAANQKADYFQLSAPGNIAVLDDGRTRFVPSANGKHRYLTVDPAQKEHVLKAYTELAATKPTPPAGRGFRGQQANQAADPAAAAAGDKPDGAAPPAAAGNKPAPPPGGRNQERR